MFERVDELNGKNCLRNVHSQETGGEGIVEPVYLQILIHSLIEMTPTGRPANKMVNSFRKVMLKDMLRMDFNILLERII